VNVIRTLISFLVMAAFGSSSWAQTTASKDIRYTKGLLKKISCVYSGSTRTPTGPTLGDVDFPVDTANTVCDPLTNTPAPTPLNGLLGKLIMKTPEMAANVSSVMDYYYNGQKLSQDLFFADVNVPTQLFTKGFSTVDGQLLVDGNGVKLTENFAIEYTSILKLSDTDKEGHYEIPVLSDDGARLFVKENGVWTELANNDGVHPTRMGCPYRTVEMKRNKELPIKLLYYQGPKYHISNVLMWKYYKTAQVWKDPSKHSLCGYQGNDLFFSADGKKTKAMKTLEADGYSIISKSSYKMPEQTQNPCSLPELVLSAYAIQSYSGTSAVVSWSTNLPASSQLRVSNLFTGEEILTVKDVNLLTEHSVQVNGLVPGVSYQIQAISVDANGREIRSSLATVP